MLHICIYHIITYIRSYVCFCIFSKYINFLFLQPMTIPTLKRIQRDWGLSQYFNTSFVSIWFTYIYIYRNFEVPWVLDPLGSLRGLGAELPTPNCIFGFIENDQN